MAKKPGRKPDYWVDPRTNKPIVGLSRRSYDDRFYATQNRNKTFGTDPEEAVFRFYQWKAREAQSSVTLEDSPGEDGTLDITRLQEHLEAPFTLVLGKDGPALKTDVPEEVFWAKVRELILKDLPEFSRKVSLNVQVLDKPVESISLGKVGDLYEAKTDVTPKTKAKMKKWWEEFTEAVAPSKTVADITVDHVRRYRDGVLGMGFGPKTIAHRFHAIRTLLRNAQVEGYSSPELTLLLDHCKMLKPPRQSNGGDPHPVSRGDLEKLLAKADVIDTALILMGLNCAMLAKELSDLDQEDIDLDKGVLVTRRQKKGQVVRAAVIWPRTCRAVRRYLKAFPHDRVSA